MVHVSEDWETLQPLGVVERTFKWCSIQGKLTEIPQKF